METWTWWPRGPLSLEDAEQLLELLVDAKHWDGRAGLSRCLIAMLRDQPR